jgi:FlaA1/EpsC-like NDP-sugar epimerase
MSIALITGGSGHVGSNLVRKLQKRVIKYEQLILMEIIEPLKVLMLSLVKGRYYRL